MWNWQFEQATYNLHAANASVLVDGDPFRLNYDGVNNSGYWAWRRVAYMAKHVADIFGTGERPVLQPDVPGARNGTSDGCSSLVQLCLCVTDPLRPPPAVFGRVNVGSGQRVRPLLSGQVVQPIIVGEGLRYLENVFGPPNSILHGIAGAPYFNIAGGYNQWANLTVDEVFAGFNISSECVSSHGPCRALQCCHSCMYLRLPLVASMALSVGVGEDNYIAGRRLRESVPTPMWKVHEILSNIMHSFSPTSLPLRSRCAGIPLRPAGERAEEEPPAVAVAVAPEPCATRAVSRVRGRARHVGSQPRCGVPGGKG